MKYFSRTNLNKKLKQILSYPITFISAPGGCGKSVSVSQFLSTQKIHVVKFSFFGELYEEWAFSKIQQNLAHELPLYEDCNAPIPTTRKDVDGFMNNLDSALKKPLCIVLDDVTPNAIPALMNAVQTYSYMPHERIHFVIISRETLLTHTFSLCAHTYIALDHSDFAMSKTEIALFAKTNGITLNEHDVSFLYNLSKGWISAVQLALQSYKKQGNFYHLSPLDSLLKEVLYNNLDTSTQQSLMKLSLLREFTFDQALLLCEDKTAIETIMKLEKDNFFIHSTTHQKHCIAPLFKEFLQKELNLSSLDKRALLIKTGTLLLTQKEPVESIAMFYEARYFEGIIEAMIAHIDIEFFDMAPQLMNDVFVAMDDQYKNRYPQIYLKWIFENFTNELGNNALFLLEDFKQRVENNLVVGNKKQLMGEYHYIHAFAQYNDLSAMFADFKEAHAYFDGGVSQFISPYMVATFGSHHILYLYFNAIGDYKKTRDLVVRDIHYFTDISKGLNAGGEYQVQAEYAYDTGEYSNVINYACSAFNVALQKGQISIAIASLFLQARYALLHFDQYKYNSLLKALHSMYNESENPIVHCELDCAISHLHILNNHWEEASTWLKEAEFKHAATMHEAHLIAPIIHGLYLIKTKSFEILLTLSKFIEDANRERVHAYSLVYAQLFKTISTLYTTDLDLVIHEFKSLLQLCAPDAFISPIVELAVVLEPLILTHDCENDYERRLIKSCKTYIKQYHTIHDQPSKQATLTSKENIVLALVAKNKTAKEIAKELNLSTNTVQTHMKSIYRKLEVNTKVAAIRHFEKTKK